MDSNALSIDYFNFTKPNTWGTTALTSTANSGNFAADDIKGMRFTEHPSTEEVMVIAQDIGEDVRAIRWNGTNFVTPNASVLESLTEVVNGAQESAMFAWFKYDSKPNVTSVNPSGVNYAVSASVEINASITDNIGIDTVLANVTLPNNSISQLTLLDSNSDEIYNGTFTITDNIGSYTIRIIANDTGNNVNSSETANFNVVDSNNPNVTALLPVNGTSFNATVTFEISANVTDDVNISTVLANITYPNETINQIVLSNDTFANKFNNSFMI